MADKYNPTQFKDLMGYLTRPSEDKKRMREYFETNDPVEFGKEVLKRAIPVDFTEIPVLQNVSIGMAVPNRLEAGANFNVGGGELMFSAGKQGQDEFAGIGFRKEFSDGGRMGFKDKPLKNFNRNPGGTNQFTLRTDSEIQKIINNPKYKNYTRKDFRNEKILTRKETERKGLKFKNFGKKVKVDKRANQNLKQSSFIKSAQGSSISMDKINNFAHYAPKLKTYLVSTSDTGPLKATVNRAAEGYDKEALKIAQKQETLLKDKPKNYKEKLIKENYKAANLSKKANKELPKGLKGTLGYFVVNPDSGKFTLKGVDRAKTFAGISGEKREFIKMNPSERKSYGPSQSALQTLIDLVKKKVPGANINRASNAPIPNAKNSDMFKKASIRLGIPGGSGDRPLKDPLGGQIDLIDVKELIKKPYDNT